MSGLEIVASIASVAQLATTVYSISKILYEVSDTLSHAPSDIKDLARDLETFSEELQLLSTVLESKRSYADQIHRLIAKIIGDCATICGKIDRILKKLRNGKILARMKWLYKEKEIMKLLARLRDLKLSLMSTLSFMSVMKADHIMDTLGVPNQSLLLGSSQNQNHGKTLQNYENLRGELATIEGHWKPVAVTTEDIQINTRISRVTNPEFEKNVHQLRGLASCGVPIEPIPIVPAPRLPVEREITETRDNEPSENGEIRTNLTDFSNAAAMESVQSFHSAVSHQSKVIPGEGNNSPLSMAQMLEPVKRLSVKPRSSFTPIDESCSILSQHWVSSTTYTEPMRSDISQNSFDHIHESDSNVGARPTSLGKQHSGYSETPKAILTNSDCVTKPRMKSDEKHDTFSTDRCESNESQPILGGVYKKSEELPTEIRCYHLPKDYYPTANCYPLYTAPIALPPEPNDDYTSAPDDSFGNIYYEPQSLYANMTPPTPISQHQNTNRMLISNTFPETVLSSNDATQWWSKSIEDDRTPAQQRRKAQNRAAQKAFRERKDRNARDLETKLTAPEKNEGRIMEENEHLRIQTQYKGQENGVLQSNSTQSKPFSIASSLEYGLEVPYDDFFADESLSMKRQQVRWDVSERKFSTRECSRDSFQIQSIPQSQKGRQLWNVALEKLRKSGDFKDHGIFLTVTHTRKPIHTYPGENQLAQESSTLLLNTIEIWLQTEANLVSTNSPLLMRAFSRIKDIIQVIETTLDFQIGGLFWSYFCRVLNDMINHTIFWAIDPDIFTILADIATLVARYNVLESIYHQWLTVTLDADYEKSLIQLCILIFRYIGHASELVFRPSEKEDEKEIMSSIAQEIELADEHCRKFSFTFFGEDDLAREVVDMSSDEEEDKEKQSDVATACLKRKFNDSSDGVLEPGHRFPSIPVEKRLCPFSGNHGT